MSSALEFIQELSADWKEAGDELHYGFYMGILDLEDQAHQKAIFDKYGVTDLKEIDSEGGEGQGDHAHIVYQVTQGDTVTLVRDDGFYSSYEGTDWDNEWYVVVPVEKMVTFYEPI